MFSCVLARVLLSPEVVMTYLCCVLFCRGVRFCGIVWVVVFIFVCLFVCLLVGWLVDLSVGWFAVLLFYLFVVS